MFAASHEIPKEAQADDEPTGTLNGLNQSEQSTTRGHILHPDERTSSIQRGISDRHYSPRG
jgi:hypothetical protein